MGNFRKSIGQYKRSDFLNRGIIYKEKHNKRTFITAFDPGQKQTVKLLASDASEIIFK